MCINLNRYTHTYRCPNSLSLPKDRMQHTEMLSLDDFDHWVPKFCIFVVSENPLAYSYFGICWFLNSLHFVKSPKFDPCGSYLVRPLPTCTRV